MIKELKKNMKRSKLKNKHKKNRNYENWSLYKKQRNHCLTGEEDNCPMDNCPLDSCPQNISPRAIAFPPRTIAPRIIPSGQFPPRIIVLRKIAPQTILTYENCPRINTPGQFPPRIIDLRGR